MRAKSYAMKVVEIDGCGEYEVPVDTVTREGPVSGSGGPYIPLAYRTRRDVFYICSARWPHLAGKALRVELIRAKPAGIRRIPPPEHPVWRRVVSGEVPLRPSFLGACMFLGRARADLRQPGGGSLIELYVGQLQGLYAHNAGCGSVQRDLAIMCG